MGDSVDTSDLSRNAEVLSVDIGKNSSRKCFASGPNAFSLSNYRHIASGKHGKMGSSPAADVGFFILKIVALETVRRFSRAKCPLIWRGIQALQVLCYPPFKWIQKWAAFNGLIKCTQMLSRPMLVLSIATAFSEEVGDGDETSDGCSDSVHSELHAEPSIEQSTSDTRVIDDTPQSPPSEYWLIQLLEELENQGIRLPDRMNEEELHRFYTAVNCHFPCLLSSIKKTISWMDTYRFISGAELEMWSTMVFWHGFDVKHRPCLVVRLGIACRLLSEDRPRFVQAVVSQVDYGVMHLVGAETPQITVLMDCEGLSPFRFPMQMMRSCSSLLQNHYPDRLGCLFVIRLPPVVRVIAQTFMQLLKPITREKIKIEGKMYQKVLCDYLQEVPAYLDGKCTCTLCSKTSNSYKQHPCANEINIRESITGDKVAYHPSFNPGDDYDISLNGNCNQIMKTAIIAIVMLCALIALMEGTHGPVQIFLGMRDYSSNDE